MERNWDTVRELLLATEALEPTKDLILGDYPKERAHEISYHVQMLTNAGMLDATIWERTKSSISEQGGPMTLGIIQALWP